MKGSSIKYLLKEGLHNIKTNRLMSLVSVCVLAASLILIGFTLLLTKNVENMIGFIEHQNDVVIYLQDQATDDQISRMYNDFKQEPYVSEVDYISKDQALSDYIATLKDPNLVESLQNSDKFLPASLRVSVNDVSKINDLLSKAQTYDIYSSSAAPTGAADTIIRFKNTFTVISGIIIIALVIISLVVISNTIRATVFARRTEIAIMKQVGATDNFIRIPFFTEGILIGIFSSVITYIVIWISYTSITKFLMHNTSAFLSSMYQYLLSFSDIRILLAVGVLITGIFAGALGSVVSLRKHLKV